MDWSRVSILNSLSMFELLQLCDKVEVPLQVRAVLPLSIPTRILENLPPPSDRQWFLELRHRLMHAGQGDHWRFILMKYGDNPAELYYKLGEILKFEIQEVQVEDNIIENLAESGQSLNIYRTSLDIQERQSQRLGLPVGPLDSQVPAKVLQVLNAVVHILTEKMERWKHEHRHEMSWQWPDCTKIQGWVNKIFDQAVALRECIQRFPTSDGVNVAGVKVLFTESARLISRIANCAFLPEMNPPRFVKKELHFALKYRHLLGRKLFGADPSESVAKIAIINAEQYAHLSVNDDHFENPIGSVSAGCLDGFELQIGRRKLDPDFPEHLIIEYKEVQIARGRLNPSREARANVNTIKNEKFCFLVEFQVRISTNLKITVWTISPPVIAGTNANQELRSLATIFWDSTLCRAGRKQLTVSDNMPCWKLINALEHLQLSHVGVGFSDINRAYLRDRVLRRKPDDPIPRADAEITFLNFCELPIYEHFTFWEWFMGALKFSEEYFRDMWKEGYIFGFFGRPNLGTLMEPCEPGTIVLHFSESSVGGIVMSWKNSDTEVRSAGPYSVKQLQNTSLPEIIADTTRGSNFKFIYPDKELAAMLQRYYKPPPASTRGYVRIVNRLKIDADLPSGAH